MFAVKSKIAEKLNIPQDISDGLPIVTITGKNLEIVYYTNVDMKITGEIESICYS